MPIPFVLGAAALAYAISFLTTPISARVAVRFGILDHPKAWYKGHSRPVPYLGGLAILVGTSAGIAFAALAPADADQPHWWIILAAAPLLALVGLVDDARELPKSVRFAVQLSAALIAWAAGFRVELSGHQPVDLTLTLIWIVGMTNAFNLLDNIDGLTAGLGGVGALSFSILGLAAGLNFLAAFAAGLAGACFGFLMHNRYPAKIFMGDSGSTYIGYLLALIGMALRFDNLLRVTFLIPVIVLGVPILDTTLVVVSRLLARRPVFEGGRDHMSHRMVRAGLPVKAAVGFLYWAGACLGWLGLVISQSTARVGFMLLGFVLALGVFFGAMLWRVPVYEDVTQSVTQLKKEGEG